MPLALLPPAPAAGVSTSSRAAASTRTRAGEYVAARAAGKIAENPVGWPAASPRPDDAVAKSIACGARTPGPVSARGSSSGRASAEHAWTANPARQPSRTAPRPARKAVRTAKPRPSAESEAARLARAPTRATAPGVRPQPSSPSWAPRAPAGRRPLLTEKNLVTAEMRCQLKGVDGAAGRAEGRARVEECAGSRRLRAVCARLCSRAAVGRRCGEIEYTWPMRGSTSRRSDASRRCRSTMLAGGRWRTAPERRQDGCREAVPPSVAPNVSSRGRRYAALLHAPCEPKRHKNSPRVRLRGVHFSCDGT